MRFLFVSFLFFLGLQQLSATVIYKLEYSASNQTYTVSLKSTAAYSGGLARFTSSTQVTLVAPDTDGSGVGIFELTNLTGLQAGAVPLSWSLTQINSPVESPNKDYLFLAPANAGSYTLFNIPANTWLPLFSFKSDAGCSGNLYLYDNNASTLVEPMNGQVTYNTKQNCKILGGGNVNLWNGNDNTLASCVALDNDGDGVTSTTDPDDNNPCSPSTTAGPCDADNDGLTNTEEAAAGTLPTDSDTDNDSVLDGADGQPLNPCSPSTTAGPCDADNDGLTNTEEAAAGTLPTDADTDNDSVLDGADGQPLNPCSPSTTAGPCDADNDGLTNAEEAAAGTLPTDADTDNDSVLDGADVQPLNPCAPSTTAGPCDADNDGLTNTEEAAAGTLPTDADTDNDSVLDGADIAPLDPCVPNACGTPLYLRVLLGAAYNPTTNLMHDKLRLANLIPASQPYNGGSYLDFAYNGTEQINNVAVLQTTGVNAIVDWILVELRQANAPSTAVARQAALLQRDGDIVGTDGISPIVFTGISTGSYFVVVRHRNHLGVMTQTAQPFVGTTALTIDFSASTLPNYELTGSTGSAFAQQTSSNQKRMLWAGNLYNGQNSGNRVIFQSTDADADEPYFQILLDANNSTLSPVFIQNNYARADANLDGFVIWQGADSDADVPFYKVLQHPDNVLSQNIFIVYEQLP